MRVPGWGVRWPSGRAAGEGAIPGASSSAEDAWDGRAHLSTDFVRFTGRLWQSASPEDRAAIDGKLRRDETWRGEQWLKGWLLHGVAPASSSVAASLPPVATVLVSPGPEAAARYWASLDAHPDADLVIAPEYFLSGHSPETMPKSAVWSADRFRRFRDALVARSEEHPGLLVPGSVLWWDEDGQLRNTALVAHAGDLLVAYDKRNLVEESAWAEAWGRSARAGQTPGLFSFRGRPASIEICRDHADGRALQDLFARGQGAVALQLVVSAGVWIHRPAVGPGGVIVVAQGDGRSEHEVYRCVHDGPGRFEARYAGGTVPIADAPTRSVI